MNHKKVFEVRCSLSGNLHRTICGDGYGFARRDSNRLIQLDILFQRYRAVVFRCGSGIDSLLQRGGVLSIGNCIANAIINGLLRVGNGDTLRKRSCDFYVILRVVDYNFFQCSIICKDLGIQALHAAANLKFFDCCAAKCKLSDRSHTIRNRDRTAQFFRIPECIGSNRGQCIRELNRGNIRIQKGPFFNGSQFIAQGYRINTCIAECFARDFV